MSIQTEVATADLLLGMAPAELAQIVLRRIVGSNTSPAPVRFIPYQEVGKLLTHARQATLGRDSRVYGGQSENEVELALIEAVHWLSAAGLTAPDAIDGAVGRYVVTRLGRRVAANPAAFESFRRAQAFPKELLHPLIADEVWMSLARGKLTTAVFEAFRAVEERVREACGFGPEEFGVDMVRRAFHPETGPLRKSTDPKAEREGLLHMGAGAYLSYKNPHSHRTVTLTEPLEAQEMVMLASHLLRIIDARAPARESGAI